MCGELTVDSTITYLYYFIWDFIAKKRKNAYKFDKKITVFEILISSHFKVENVKIIA